VVSLVDLLKPQNELSMNSTRRTSPATGTVCGRSNSTEVLLSLQTYSGHLSQDVFPAVKAAAMPNTKTEGKDEFLFGFGLAAD